MKTTDKKVEDWMRSTDKKVEDWMNALSSGSPSQAVTGASYASVVRATGNSSTGQQPSRMGSGTSSTLSRSTHSASSSSERSIMIDLHDLHESVQLDSTEIASVRAKLEAAIKAYDVTSMVKIRSFNQR